ncbi:MAG: hypothetical protein ACI9CE_001064 [Flavobacterium sp.]|jgi:hypothetical protein
MIKKVLISWRDIPSQVLLQRGRIREKVMLSPRFQEAIDRAAMRAGKGGSEAYIEEWNRQKTMLDSKEDLKVLATTIANEIEAQYSDDLLLVLIRSHGVLKDPEGSSSCIR